jgi:outer membrane cobalamin receptor
VSSDNLEFIPAYHVGAISLRKTLNFSNQKLTIQGEVLNLWDADYQSYRYYPMPGRSFKISLILSIN